MMKDNKSNVLTPEQLVKSLRACAGAGSECKRCAKEVGFGCSRDLKIQAADMLEKLIKERDVKKD